MSYNIFEFLIVSFIAVILISFVALRPRLFWPLLLVVNIFGNGPRFMGYYLADELFTACILFGAFMYLSIINPQQRKQVLTLHGLLFMSWISYMIIESFIGVIANNDLRIIRWVIFYTILGILSAVIYYRGKEFPFPDFRQLALIIINTTIIYYSFCERTVF